MIDGIMIYRGVDFSPIYAHPSSEGMIAVVADHMPPELIRIMWGYSHGRSFESRVDALK